MPPPDEPNDDQDGVQDKEECGSVSGFAALRRAGQTSSHARHAEMGSFTSDALREQAVGAVEVVALRRPGVPDGARRRQRGDDEALHIMRHSRLA